MSYIDGVVLAVAEDRQAEFLDHAKRIDPLFIEFGATRVVEGWAADVPRGETTDFYRAVAAEAGETVAFAWIEWPDKATRDAGMARLPGDPRMAGPVPFDGKRMIFGGFIPVVEERWRDTTLGFFDAFVAPLPAGKRDAFVKMSTEMAPMFGTKGALFDIETCGDDVPDGTVTSFRKAVKAEGDEMPGISIVGWPDKATRDAAWAKMMQEPPPADMPFDGKRLFFGGFEAVFELRK